MKLALLSNVTVDVLAGLLRPEHELWLAPGFGAWMETALDAPADLRAFAPEAVFLLLDSSHARFDPAAVDAAVAALEAALPQAAVIVPDLADLAPGTDERMWKVAAMPWSLKGLHALRDEIGRLCTLMRSGAKKVLALDFDNTLWDGVVGEDGVARIVPRRDFQRALRALRERGVLLVGLSKNNASDVAPVWDDPRMVLGRDDFADLRTDWNDKSANLSAAARALGLGTDSFVFLDDDPAERAQMRAAHPEVAVPEDPTDLRHVTRLYFPKMRVTAEDRRKTEAYRAEARRGALAATLSADDYLRDLEIRTEVHPVTAEEFARVAQLSQKANQFNVRTHRRTAADVARFAADPSQLVVTLHASDRFGDLGLVGFVHASAGEVVDFVMSCRAMNRRLEFALWRFTEDALRARGVRRISAAWRRTAKNEPVRGLFEKLGFGVVSADGEGKTYEKVLV